MSLVSSLIERRETMDEKLIANFVEGFLPKVEAHVDADIKSRHIEVILEFEQSGNEAVLKLNGTVVESFDISNLLGTPEEKFFRILNALEGEGFENKSTIKRETWNDEYVATDVFAIGFDI